MAEEEEKLLKGPFVGERSNPDGYQVKRFSRFQNSMDLQSVKGRILHNDFNLIYALASQAAGHQGQNTVDVLFAGWTGLFLKREGEDD